MTEPPPGNTSDAQKSESVSTTQRRIAQLARERPETAFTSLAHLIDLDWLKEACARTRKDGAVGVDGQTAADYEADLEGNLRRLLDRAKAGTYRAPPVRRVHIPKAGSTTETRPLGIPTLEDKILQRAVLMLLEPLYEADFLPASHGFRPGRSAHGALEAIRTGTMRVGGGWIADVDLRKYSDTIDHGRLREFLKRRMRDGVLTRLIGKWLNAGALEDGQLSFPDQGTPQGGVISPPTTLQNRPSSRTLLSPGRGSDRSTGKDGSPGSIPVQGRLKAAISERRSRHDHISKEIHAQPSRHPPLPGHSVSDSVDRACIPGIDPGRLAPSGTAAISTG